MKIVAFSDIHGLHDGLEIPDADVLIFAGDFTGHYIWRDLEFFWHWIYDLPHKHILVVAGNHDFAFEKDNKRARKIMRGITYLQDEAVVINGIKFYGSPWTPKFLDWAFMLPRGGEEIKQKWAKIPDNTDVLITHGPPHSICDYIEWEDVKDNVGCEYLYDRVLELDLKAHFFGHIHMGYGQTDNSYNVSICNEKYAPINKPVVIDLK